MWSNEEDFEEETLTPEQEAALPYARYMAAGFRVMPLHRILELPGHALGCGCGHAECKAVGKHPVAAPGSTRQCGTQSRSRPCG